MSVSQLQRPSGASSNGLLEHHHRRRLEERGLEIHLALSATLLAGGEYTSEGDEIVDLIARRVAPEVQGLRTLTSRLLLSVVYVTAPGVAFDRDFLQAKLFDLESEAARQSRSVRLVEPRNVFGDFARTFPRHAAGCRRRRFLIGYASTGRCPDYVARGVASS
ncbi:MAG: hypothetical protein DI565_02495 [Ancylobacter novellus]|uniref:Uncharacterized protein n=1 Tax=Ancylobacter novellus TaxID=921 RepID=A0A2W5MNI3_ANCNO|nr:MAG: hypothetical protein DI565_02495 [Ancylobacter novellus]